MGQKNVTLSLDENIYEQYQDFCKDNAIALSKSIENFMKDRLKNEN